MDGVAGPRPDAGSWMKRCGPAAGGAAVNEPRGGGRLRERRARSSSVRPVTGPVARCARSSCRWERGERRPTAASALMQPAGLLGPPLLLLLGDAGTRGGRRHPLDAVDRVAAACSRSGEPTLRRQIKKRSSRGLYEEIRLLKPRARMASLGDEDIRSPVRTTARPSDLGGIARMNVSVASLERERIVERRHKGPVGLTTHQPCRACVMARDDSVGEAVTVDVLEACTALSKAEVPRSEPVRTSRIGGRRPCLVQRQDG